MYSSERRAAGHRRNVRAITDVEVNHLLELKDNKAISARAFNDYIVELYMSGVSQQSTATILRISQSAVHLKVMRHLEFLAAEKAAANTDNVN